MAFRCEGRQHGEPERNRGAAGFPVPAAAKQHGKQEEHRDGNGKARRPARIAHRCSSLDSHALGDREARLERVGFPLRVTTLGRKSQPLPTDTAPYAAVGIAPPAAAEVKQAHFRSKAPRRPGGQGRQGSRPHLVGEEEDDVRPRGYGASFPGHLAPRLDRFQGSLFPVCRPSAHAARVEGAASFGLTIRRRPCTVAPL
jgi:hypothetical protein